MIPVQQPSLGEEEINLVKRVFDSRWLGLGSTVKEFEEELKKFLGAKYVMAVNSGTSALHITLDAFGIRAGDEVVVPSLTFVATIQAIISCGAKPVFCDVYPDTLNIDIDDTLKNIGPRVKAIVPVHYGGLPCRMDELIDISRRKGVLLIEDAAHAFGSSYKGRKIGNLSDATCFSFDPIKNITCGEGGAVVLDNEEICQNIYKRRILGIDKDTWSRYKNERSWFYEVNSPGFRYHMNNINAAIGLAQLKKFPKFVKRKREIMRRYDDAFREVEDLELLSHDYQNSAPFFYVIKVKKKRDALMNFLKENGIGTGIHYIPNHLQPFLVSIVLLYRLLRKCSRTY